MEGSLRKELYSDTLELSGMEHGLKPTPDFPEDVGDSDLEDEDASPWSAHDDDDSDGASDLNREWQKRCDQFHTIGFRDGAIAGQQAIAQAGFNSGFKRSAVVGYNWGVVRGITSAISCLPDELKEKLIETQERREKFQSLHESVQSISTTDALKLFYDDVATTRSAAKEIQNAHVETRKAVEENAHAANSNFRYNHLQDYTKELQSLAAESPAIISHLLPQ